MDSSAAAADFSLTTGGAAQSASHLQAIASSVLPPQHHPSLAEHIHDSSSQVYVIPLHIMGTQCRYTTSSDGSRFFVYLTKRVFFFD